MSSAVGDWDPLDTAVVADPLAAHADLRARCPVARTERWGGFWSLTKYRDICDAARDTETFSSRAPTIPPFDFGQEGPLGIPIELDPPETKKYRQLLGPYFTPKRMEAQADAFRALVDGYLDPLIERGGGDVVAGFTHPYPAVVLCLSILRAPERDWSMLRELTGRTLQAAAAGDEALVAATGRAVGDYIDALVRDRRAAPLDPADDMISGLLVAEVDGAPLADETIAAIMRLILPAGHDTTANALSNAILHLARHPEDQQRLRADPSLIPIAIEELLRCYAPIQQLSRRAMRDADVRGRTIREGDSVGLMWLSGNRDEDAFPDADRCILDRSPNRHIAFGFGVHHCLGAPLARVELRVALEQLLARTTRFELDGPLPAERVVFPLYGPAELPLRLHA